MKTKLLLLSLLAAVISISATRPQVTPEAFQQKLLGTWKLKQVKEIGNWAIQQKDVTAAAQFEKITFKKAFAYSVDTDSQHVEGKWQLENKLEPNYQPNMTVPVLYYPKKVLILDEIRDQLLPGKWEDVSVSKKKLIFYVQHNKGKLKYTLSKMVS